MVLSYISSLAEPSLSQQSTGGWTKKDKYRILRPLLKTCFEQRIANVERGGGEKLRLLRKTSTGGLVLLILIICFVTGIERRFARFESSSFASTIESDVGSACLIDSD